MGVLHLENQNKDNHEPSDNDSKAPLNASLQIKREDASDLKSEILELSTRLQNGNTKIRELEEQIETLLLERHKLENSPARLTKINNNDFDFYDR